MLIESVNNKDVTNKRKDDLLLGMLIVNVSLEGVSKKERNIRKKSRLLWWLQCNAVYVVTSRSTKCYYFFSHR